MIHYIGIDASRAVSQAPTGVEGYSFHLIRAMLPALRARGWMPHLYFNRYAAVWDDIPATERRVIPFPRLWTHVRLSAEMALHSPDVLFIPAHVIPPLHPRRTLVTVHDLGYRYFPEAHPLRQRLYLDLTTRWNVHTAAHVLADSQATKDALCREYRVLPAKISVVYPGYESNLAAGNSPEAQSRVRARYGISGEYVLYLGRIQPRKNLVRLIAAFARLQREAAPPLSDLTLVLAGPGGWMADPIRIRAAALGRKVLFPGYIPAEDKAALIAGARVFAFPSLYEGFGFPVLEAQACGVPLLSSATSSLPEVVGAGGLLVNPEDDAALTAGLQRLLIDEPLRRVLVAQGYENVRRFSWERAAQQVVQIIENL